MATKQTAKKQVAVNDIGSAEDFLAAVEATLKFFNDGDLISGTIVKIDRDEVLVDVGYKTEGVIPIRELSIRQDADPNDIVKVGDAIEALVLQKEDKEGRLILSKKRAQYERAWGDVEKIKEADGVVKGIVIEVVKGGVIVDIGLRGFLPASLIELRRVRDLGPYLGTEVEEIDDLVEVHEGVVEDFINLVEIWIEALDGVEIVLRDEVFVFVVGAAFIRGPKLRLMCCGVANELVVLELPALQAALVVLAAGVDFHPRQ